MVSKTVSRVAAVALTGLFLGSCQDDMQSSFGTSGKALRPLNAEMRSLMETKGMRKEDPILVRAFKQEQTLEVWKRDKTGRFALLKSYPLCTVGGVPGPKIREGDKQSPEGFYTITPGRMNPNSQYHLAYDVGYPNAFDRAWGRTGAAIMVHGACVASAGCFIGTNEQMEEIYALAREAFQGGQKSFQFQAYPFRMTAENLAKHRRSSHLAFWKNLKQGHDHFEVTKLEPKVEVCEKRYVFDPRIKDPNSNTFNASGACPAFEVPEEIATRVAEKQAQDDQAFKVAVAQIEDADRKETERLVAEKLEKSKPQPGTAVAAWFGGKPADEVAVAVAPTPIAVPLPRVSPLMSPTQVALATDAVAPAEKSFTDRLFSFGAASSAPADSAAQAIATPVAAQPIAVPVPAARPNPAGGASYSTASTPAPAASAGEGEPSMWKKLNPFGG